MLRPKRACVFANDADILPATSLYTHLRNFAKRRRQIDEVDVVKGVLDTRYRIHLFDIPAGAGTNVNPDRLATSRRKANRDLCSQKAQHVFPSSQ